MPDFTNTGKNFDRYSRKSFEHIGIQPKSTVVIKMTLNRFFDNRAANVHRNFRYKVTSNCHALFSTKMGNDLVRHIKSLADRFDGISVRKRHQLANSPHQIS